MTKIEIQTFIETMEEIGDIWTEEEVERAYGEDTLEEALANRSAEVNLFLNTLGTALLDN